MLIALTRKHYISHFIIHGLDIPLIRWDFFNKNKIVAAAGD